MALQPKQAKRRAAFESGLGEDKLAITRFDGTEEMSELFQFKVEAVSSDKNIDFNQVLGTKCKIRINTTDGRKRYFNGFLVEAHSHGKVQDVFSYSVVLRPWLWLLSKTSNCKIFKEKSVTDIIAEVFHQHSFAKFEDRTGGGYPQLEYCVQYCESDFQFVSRLMEEYGIFYFFEHSESDHLLVLANSKSAYKARPGGAALRYVPYEDKHFQNEETLNDWVKSRQFCSGKFVMKDYYYETPGNSLLSEQSNPGPYENSSLEVFYFPGRYEQNSAGSDKTKAWMEAEQSQDERCRASGDAVSCSPGGKIELKDHPQVTDGTEFVVLGASHAYRAPSYRATGQTDDDTYTGNFEFLPTKIPFRCLQKTPKPRISGPQTGFVEGSGEIDVDDEGRIEVLFHWSRDRGNVTSRRVRIAHGWSGAGWGDIKIPRVGMEVVVEFLNGDPDQPLVTGTVYNADNKVPYPLQEDKTISGVKSKTDGGDGYNEFIFDDRPNEELIRFHAERDLDGTVKHDERRHVGNDVTVKIDNNRKENIGMEWKAEAGTKIEFICGQSSIVMEPAKITIKSLAIEINASANLQATGSAMATFESKGITTITGALVKIN